MPKERNWFTPAIIVAILMGIPGYWQMFHPNPALQSSVQGPGIAQSKQADPMPIAHPFLLGLSYAAPMLSGIALIAAVMLSYEKENCARIDHHICSVVLRGLPKNIGGRNG